MTDNNSPKPSNDSTESLDGFVTSLGVSIEPEILDLALTHRSWAFENDAAPHNERLEFLGDSVLGFAITGLLYQRFPKLSEGDLAKRRAAVVSTKALAEIGRTIGIGKFIKLGKGEIMTGGAEKESILADTVEAFIGAVYLSNGIDEAAQFVIRLLQPLLKNIGTLSLTLDPKTTLQEVAAHYGLSHPQYSVTGTGPDHNRRYHASVEVLGVRGDGSGSSKKAAELEAAQDAVLRLHEFGKVPGA